MNEEKKENENRINEINKENKEKEKIIKKINKEIEKKEKELNELYVLFFFNSIISLSSLFLIKNTIIIF